MTEAHRPETREASSPSDVEQAIADVLDDAVEFARERPDERIRFVVGAGAEPYLDEIRAAFPDIEFVRADA